MLHIKPDKKPHNKKAIPFEKTNTNVPRNPRETFHFVQAHKRQYKTAFNTIMKSCFCEIKSSCLDGMFVKLIGGNLQQVVLSNIVVFKAVQDARGIDVNNWPSLVVFNPGFKKPK